MIELGAVIKPGLVQFSHSVTSNSATPWTAACQASLSITNSGSLLKLSCTSSQWCHPTSHPLSCPSPPSSLLLSHFQWCPTLCEPIDGSPPGCPVPGILQTRTLEWAAISFSNAGKWKVKVKLLSHIQLLATPWTAAYQALPSMGFSRQEYWSGVPLPSPHQAWRTPKIVLLWTTLDCLPKSLAIDLMKETRRRVVSKSMLSFQGWVMGRAMDRSQIRVPFTWDLGVQKEISQDK